MTVLVVKTTMDIEGDGVTSDFDFDFIVQKAEDVRAIIELDGDPVFDGTNNATVVINENQKINPGGTVTYPIAGDKLTSNDIITIKRGGAFTQPNQYINNEVISAEAVEAQLDLAAIERQEIQDDYINFENEVPIPLPPPSANLSIQDIIQIDRPTYRPYEDDEIGLYGGAFYTNGTRPRVITVNSFASVDVGTLSPYTPRYIYIIDYEVETQDNTVIAGRNSSLLETSDIVPIYDQIKGGFYNGKNKCIFVIPISSTGTRLDFKHDGGDLVTFDNGITTTYTANLSSSVIYSLSLLGVPLIIKAALLNVRFKGYRNEDSTVYYSGFDPTISYAKFTQMAMLRDDAYNHWSQFSTNLYNIPGESNPVFRIQGFCDTGYELTIETTGWYLPKGL